MKQAFFDLGVESPFTFTEGTESLCGIFQQGTYDCTNLIISKVIQKTVVDVNEKGVEAAAVTMVGVSFTSMGSQFFIYEKEEDLMLLEGRLVGPAVPEDASDVALLGGSQADSDFWKKTFYVNTTKAPVPDATMTSSISAITTPEAMTTEKTRNHYCSLQILQIL